MCVLFSGSVNQQDLEMQQQQSTSTAEHTTLPTTPRYGNYYDGRGGGEKEMDSPYTGGGWPSSRRQGAIARKPADEERGRQSRGRDDDDGGDSKTLASLLSSFSLSFCRSTAIAIKQGKCGILTRRAGCDDFATRPPYKDTNMVRSTDM